MSASWTLSEKRKLLEGLYEFGPKNLDALHKLLPNKTKLEIRILCEEHSRLALKKREAKSSNPPVKQWIQILKRLKASRPKVSHDLIPRVLKYIALFENRHPATSTNITECYKALSNMCLGQDYTKLDPNSDYFIYECLTTLAKCLKYGECRAYKGYLSNLKRLEDFSKHNSGDKLENFFTVNPLGIPKDFLELNNMEMLQVSSI